MRYTAYNKYFSWSTIFEVRDAAADLTYRADSDYRLHDGSGVCVASIVPTWMSNHDIYDENSLLARISERGMFSTWYEVEFFGGPTAKIEADSSQTQYAFTLSTGQLMATLRRPLFSFSKVAEIDIIDEGRALAVLACFFAIRKIEGDKKGDGPPNVGGRAKLGFRLPLDCRQTCGGCPLGLRATSRLGDRQVDQCC